jgi:hypothetical protein
MYHPKMERQMNNTHSARMPTPTGLLVGNKNSMQLPQLQVNMQTTPDTTMTTSGDKHPQLQQTTSTMNVVQTACVLETSRGTLSEMALKSTTLVKTTWEPLSLH